MKLAFLSSTQPKEIGVSTRVNAANDRDGLVDEVITMREATYRVEGKDSDDGGCGEAYGLEEDTCIAPSILD